jgi:GTP pyrophosphokinase
MDLTDRFTQALAFPVRIHAGQRRKGTAIPYLSHPLAVASLALEHGADEDEAMAALLHDAIEDGPPEAAEEIARLFGPRVAALVAGCSDSQGRPKPPWRRRKEAYLAHLAEAPAGVLLVSLADKVHNARAILLDYRQVGEALWSRFKADKAGTLWYYRAPVAAFQARQEAPRALVEELARTVAVLEALAWEGASGPG